MPFWPQEVPLSQIGTPLAEEGSEPSEQVEAFATFRTFGRDIHPSPTLRFGTPLGEIFWTENYLEI